MRQHWPLLCLALSHFAALVICKSYYSIIAPGVLISHRKYPVAITLHESNTPATIRVNISGPSLMASQEVYVHPHETKKLEFDISKLPGKTYNLLVEGLNGFTFRNQSELLVRNTGGPKIYIQTDRAVYKPSDLVQFRVVLLNEHTKPLKIREPIRIEILDGKLNRVKQFKDITLTKGVYTGNFKISKYPVMGKWTIKVTISGKYDYTRSKTITIKKYVLPKFGVYIKGDKAFIPEDRSINVTVYGKYTFDKYVEGNVTARLVNTDNGIVVQEKRLPITLTLDLEFHFDNPNDLNDIWSFRLEVELEEKYTGIVQTESSIINIYRQRYKIDIPDIEYHNNIPYKMKAKVTDWNGMPVVDDHVTPITMKHGRKEYSSYLDGKGEAIFEFDYDREANHEFKYKDSKYKYPNIYVEEEMTNGNETEFYCKLELKGNRPRLGTTLEIEVSSSRDIPYLVYMIVGHSDIVQLENIKVPPKQKTFTLKITPTIEMIPKAIIYVHYIQDGHLRYDEMNIQFPSEFENEISVVGPKEARPGEEVTLKLKAQRKAYVSILAVDLSVFLLDPSYDLNRKHIFSDLAEDQAYLPFSANVYPGLQSGFITFTNAHFPVEFGIDFITPKAKNEISLNFRKKFPETWIFQNIEITDDNTELTLDMPDTITTWRITAFSVHEVTGFGMVEEPTDIISIKPFFINLNLPYSVKRGEILSIPITVFNYHTAEVEAGITMYNEKGEFYFLEGEKRSEDQQRVERIKVPANSVVSVVYSISPQQVGEIILKVTAKNPLSNDAVQQKLRVEPEGVAEVKNNATYISVPPGETFRATFSVDIPLNVVPNSEYVALSVGGDAMVPALQNLNDLVQLPTGCGEQNMVNFVPNILVLDYLRANRVYAKRELAEKAKNYVEIGYQQQLSYRHANGGYSVFGERNNEEASTWLTAYTIRFFIKAEKYLPIEDKIIESGLQFLVEKQRENGEFPFTGFLFEPAQQNRFGLVAFILMAFLEKEKYASKYQNTIQKGLEFLNKNLNDIDSIYARSIVANTLQMAKHPNSHKVLERLHREQKKKPGLRWWTTYDLRHEKDVEITAYILMAQLGDTSKSDASDDLYILNWLIEQRNAQGGFRSTHDTVVGLQALVKFTEKYNDLKNINMQIKYTAKNKENVIVERNELTVERNNALVLQTEELPKATRSLDLEVTGTGFSLLQISYRYHLLDRNEFKHFQIQPQAKLVNPDEMSLDICFTYQTSADASGDSSETNMIIMEINFPTGFITSDLNADDLLETDIVQRVELKNSDTTLVIYFERLSAGIHHCVNVLADKIQDVMMRKPSAVLVYDYYNTSRSDTAFYNL